MPTVRSNRASDLAICEHLCSSFSIGPDDVIEWYDGPITAALRCSRCDSCALLECLDWSDSTRIRVFAMRPVARADLALYLRNRQRGTCDPSRADAELHAFLCAAGRPSRIVAFDVDAGTQLANRPFPAGETVPQEPWPGRIPAQDDQRWFTFAGVPKRDARSRGRTTPTSS